MIELIFAIVVIAITVISLPIMTQITSKGIEESIVQEAIFAASAELMGATSFYWDRNSMEDFNLSYSSRVIDIGGLCINDINSTNHRLRLGHIEQPLHRRCLESNNTNASDAAGGDFPGLNEAAHDSNATFIDSEGANIGSATGYKNDYNSTISVVRSTLPGDFFRGVADSDMKRLTITIEHSDTGDDITVLSTYSANIGEIDFFKRGF